MSASERYATTRARTSSGMKSCNGVGGRDEVAERKRSRPSEMHGKNDRRLPANDKIKRGEMNIALESESGSADNVDSGLIEGREIHQPRGAATRLRGARGESRRQQGASEVVDGL